MKFDLIFEIFLIKIKILKNWIFIELKSNFLNNNQDFKLKISKHIETWKIAVKSNKSHLTKAPHEIPKESQ